MSHKNKVVVTGISVCAPDVVGLQQFERNTLEGVSGCNYIQSFHVPEKFSRTVGIINSYYPDSHFSLDNYKKFNESFKDRQQLLAEFCIDEALVISKLKEKNKTAKEIALFIATAIGPMISMEYSFIRKNLHNNSIDSPKSRVFSFRDIVRNLSKKFGLIGPHLTIPTGCVGGCDAIIYGVNAIRQGKVECAVVGAAEAPITPLVITAFGQIKATSTRKCSPYEASCPFDKRRDGFVLGEGCGILILESEKSALDRGANILAEIKGTGSTNNCFHMTDIEANGLHIKESCQLALRDANVSPDEIDYINVHGSSTIQNDIAESNAFNMLLGKKIKNIPVTSIKSQIGHALSAANAIEMVSVIQTIKSHKIPPTINLINQDKKCQLEIVKDKFLTLRAKNILKTSSGFSGIHTAIVVGEYKK